MHVQPCQGWTIPVCRGRRSARLRSAHGYSNSPLLGRSCQTCCLDCLLSLGTALFLPPQHCRPRQWTSRCRIGCLKPGFLQPLEVKEGRKVCTNILLGNLWRCVLHGHLIRISGKQQETRPSRLGELLHRFYISSRIIEANFMVTAAIKDEVKRTQLGWSQYACEQPPNFDTCLLSLFSRPR